MGLFDTLIVLSVALGAIGLWCVAGLRARPRPRLPIEPVADRQRDQLTIREVLGDRPSQTIARTRRFVSKDHPPKVTYSRRPGERE